MLITTKIGVYLWLCRSNEHILRPNELRKMYVLSSFFFFEDFLKKAENRFQLTITGIKREEREREERGVFLYLLEKIFLFLLLFFIVICRSVKNGRGT